MSQEPTSVSIHDAMPKDITHAYWFQVYNSMSFSIVLGLPMMLYFKSLGASGTILGVLSSLAPLFTILQIPAAKLVEKTGYRAFVLRGWSIRSFFIIGMLIVPVLPSAINPSSKIVLMLFFLIGYNASRGFSSCGFLPWMSQLVPDSVRGRFVSNDQMCSLSSIVVTSLLGAAIFMFLDNDLGFTVIFCIALSGAFISLHFLKRIPDVPVAMETGSAEPVPWKKLLNYAPFKKFLFFNFVMIVAWSAGGVVSVPMIRDHFGISDQTFMLLNASWGVFFILGAYLSRKTLDRVGSKPMLVLSIIIQILHMIGWSTLSSGLLPFNWFTVGLQQATWGLGFALFQIANMRMVMGLVPVMGRSHFFAIFSVSNSLTAGLFPIFWGMVYDGLLGIHAFWGGWEWNVFSIIYLLIAGISSFSIWALLQVPEPKAMNTHEFFHELFVQSPTKALSRLFGRKPFA